MLELWAFPFAYADDMDEERFPNHSRLGPIQRLILGLLSRPLTAKEISVQIDADASGKLRRLEELGLVARARVGGNIVYYLVSEGPPDGAHVVAAAPPVGFRPSGWAARRTPVKIRPSRLVADEGPPPAADWAGALADSAEGRAFLLLWRSAPFPLAFRAVAASIGAESDDEARAVLGRLSRAGLVVERRRDLWASASGADDAAAAVLLGVASRAAQLPSVAPPTGELILAPRGPTGFTQARLRFSYVDGSSRRSATGERALLEKLDGVFEAEQTASGTTLEPLRDSPFAWPLAARAALASGWRVLDPGRILDEVVDAEDLALAVSGGDGEDWFDVRIGALVEGRRIDMARLIAEMPDDLDSLPDEAEVAVRMSDGRGAVMPVGAVRPVMEALRRVLAGGSDRLRVPRSRAPEMAALVAAGLRAHGAEALLSLADRLEAPSPSVAAALPRKLAATLRPYQAQGWAWFSRLAACGFGGILADDMGLGKTLQTLAWIVGEKRAGRLRHPVLVVATASLMGGWEDEAALRTPELSLATMHGPGRNYAAMGEVDVVLTTYAVLRLDTAAFAARRWRAVVLDEAGEIKNARSENFKAASSLDAGVRFCLTGTPVENNLGELWALMSFANPGLLGSVSEFNAQFRRPVEVDGDAEALGRLRRRVAPFILRRTKAMVADDLPPKTEVTEVVEMGDGQRAVYEAVRASMDERVRRAIAARGLGSSHVVVLAALMKLRRACCHPVLADPAAVEVGSAKIEALREHLPQLVAEGRRVLLFSQFTDVLDLVEDDLRANGVNWEWSRLDGTTRNRRERIRRFRSGEVPVFLISLKAGGKGLNLPEADVVILFDPWWNPAIEAQAIDRAHRIGQARAVLVIKLLAKGTIEERLVELKRRKEALANSLLDGDDMAVAKLLDEETIADLLSAAPRPPEYRPPVPPPASPRRGRRDEAALSLLGTPLPMAVVAEALGMSVPGAGLLLRRLMVAGEVTRLLDTQTGLWAFLGRGRQIPSGFIEAAAGMSKAEVLVSAGERAAARPAVASPRPGLTNLPPRARELLNVLRAGPLTEAEAAAEMLTGWKDAAALMDALEAAGLVERAPGATAPRFRVVDGGQR
jgi:superfamily II DNA or RNA helicase